MQIKAVKFRKNGFYTQPFAFGGEEGMQSGRNCKNAEKQSARCFRSMDPEASPAGM